MAVLSYQVVKQRYTTRNDMRKGQNVQEAEAAVSLLETTHIYRRETSSRAKAARALVVPSPDLRKPALALVAQPSKIPGARLPWKNVL